MEAVALIAIIFLCIFILGIYVDFSKSFTSKQSKSEYKDHSISYRTIKKK